MRGDEEGKKVNIDYYQFSDIVLQMQIQRPKPTLNPLCLAIANSQSVLLITVFLSFLDDAQVAVLATAALRYNREHKFYKIIVAKLFMQRYMNRVDRSLFFLFYQHPLFAAIERTNTQTLAAKMHKELAQALSKFQDTLRLIRAESCHLQQHEELQEIVDNLFFNPDLPLPKMKRQTIAMYASTPLQQHLAMLRIQESEDVEEWAEEPLLRLKEAVEEQMLEKLRGERVEQERQKVETMFYQGYKVSCSADLPSQLLEGFMTHNLLVLLLGLCSQVARTYLAVVSTIDDPMMRLTEFLLRATLYRNIVLALEEKLTCLTSAYSHLYRQLYQPPPSLPPFSIARAALSVWLQGVEDLHGRNEKIYGYVVSKLRQRNLLARIEERFEKLPSFYGQLKDALTLEEFSQQAKAEAYAENGNELELEGFFEDNFEMYEVLARDYQDYFLDISVNEFTVHWCGHSQQTTTSIPHYARHAQLLLEQTMRFFNFLIGKVSDSFPDQLKISTLRELLRQDLHFQLEKITCPAVLRIIIDALNSQIRDLVRETAAFVIFGEQVLSKYLIAWDFAEKDDLVAYFAGKAAIAEDCPPHMCFYYNLIDDASAAPAKKSEEEEESLQSQEAQIYLSQEEL